MSRLLFTIILPLSLFGFDKLTASKIFETVFLGFNKGDFIKVYTNMPQYIDTLDLTKKLQLSSLENSDIVIFDKKLELNQKELDGKILFSTNYRGFKNNSNCIGAFYWFKGRPQIVFLKDRLKKQNIRLKPFLKKYIIDEL